MQSLVISAILCMVIASALLPVSLAIILFFMSGLAVFYVVIEKNTKHLVLIILIYISKIIFVTFAYYYLDNVLIRDDAFVFLDTARAMAFGQYFAGTEELNIGTEFYIWFLSGILYVFGDHQLLIQYTGIIVFGIFLCVVCLICNLFRMSSRHKTLLILFLGIMPSFFYYTSVPLREAWLLMFLSVFVYGFLKLALGFRAMGIMLIFTGLIFLMLFHHAFLFLSPILFAITILYYLLFTRSKKSKLSSMTLISISLIVIGLLAGSFVLEGRHFQGVFDVGFGEYVETQRDNRINRRQRATYGESVNLTSIQSSLISIPKSLINYLLAPYPWQIGSAGDVIALFEAWIGFMFLIVSIFAIKKRLRFADKKRLFIFLLVVVFILIAIHSVGTTNWGTAFRHRTLHLWLLALLFFIVIDEKKSHYTRSSVNDKRYSD